MTLFKDDLSRGHNGIELSKRMSQWCRQRTTKEVMTQLDDVKIPCGEVYSTQQAIDDQHIQQAEFIQNLSYPGKDTKFSVPKSEILHWNTCHHVLTYRLKFHPHEWKW